MDRSFSVPRRLGALLSLSLLVTAVAAGGANAASGDSPAAKHNRATAAGTRGAAASEERALQAGRVVSGDFVGRVRGSRAYIGLAIRKGELLAYVCDGDLKRKRPQSISEWFRGRVRDATITLRSKRGARLEAQVAAGAIRGVVVLKSGKRLAFTATRAARGGTAEFFYAIDVRGDKRPDPRVQIPKGTFVAGWIRLADGSERGTTPTARGGLTQKQCDDLWAEIRTIMKKEFAGTSTAGEELQLEVLLLPTYSKNC